MSEEKIVYALEKEFKEKFVPLNLPILLADELLGLLAKEGYIGFKQNGYVPCVAERLAEHIKCYLSEDIVKQMDWRDFFIINENKDFEIFIHDLSWKVIRECFVKTLLDKNYFTQIPSQQCIYNLLDCAYFSYLFFSDEHLLGIESQYLNGDSIFHLQKIKTDFPTFWQNLRLGFQSNSDLREKIPLLFTQLEKALLNLRTLEEIVSLFDLDLMSLINDDSMDALARKLI